MTLKKLKIQRMGTKGGFFSSSLSSKAVDVQRLEKMQLCMVNMHKSVRIVGAFLSLIREIKHFLNTKNCTIFVFDKDIADFEMRDATNVQKLAIDGVWADRVGENEKDMADPCFKYINDLRNGFKTD